MHLFFSFLIPSSLLIFGLVNPLSTGNANLIPRYIFNGLPCMYQHSILVYSINLLWRIMHIPARIKSGNSPQFIIVRFQYSIRSEIFLQSSSWRESKRSKVFSARACQNCTANVCRKGWWTKESKEPGGRSVIPSHTKATFVSTNDHWSVYENLNLNKRSNYNSIKS